MRAEQAIMLGVGALGVYAVYRLLKTDGKSASTDPGPSLQLAPGSASAASDLDPRQVLSNPNTLLLKAQTQYRMRLELGEGLPPFDTQSSDGQIASALKQLGFVEAQVFRGDPPSRFQPSTVQNPGPGTRFVISQWGNTTMSVPRPKAMALIWQTKIPGT